MSRLTFWTGLVLALSLPFIMVWLSDALWQLSAS